MPDLKIRNVDKLIIAKLDQEAADRHMSREAFLRMYLQNLAVLNELTLLDDKYQNILSVNAEALASVASELQEAKEILRRKGGIILSHARTFRLNRKNLHSFARFC